MKGTRFCRSHYWFCGWLAPFSDIMGRILVTATCDHAALWGNYPLSDRRNRITSFSRMTCAWSTLKFSEKTQATRSARKYSNVSKHTSVSRSHLWLSLCTNKHRKQLLFSTPPPPPAFNVRIDLNASCCAGWWHSQQWGRASVQAEELEQSLTQTYPNQEWIPSASGLHAVQHIIYESTGHKLSRML